MTEIICYQCDFCDKMFDNPDDCRACEYEHLFSKVKNQIHAYDKYQNPLNLLLCTPISVEFVSCDTEKAAKAYYKWSQDHNLSSPYDRVFKHHTIDFKPGLWLYDSENNWGCGDNWVYLPDKLDELTKILEDLQ